MVRKRQTNHTTSKHTKRETHRQITPPANIQEDRQTGRLHHQQTYRKRDTQTITPPANRQKERQITPPANIQNDRQADRLHHQQTYKKTDYTTSNHTKQQTDYTTSKHIKRLHHQQTYKKRGKQITPPANIQKERHRQITAHFLPATSRKSHPLLLF